MSAVIAVFNRLGAPVAAEKLASLLAASPQRGPDGAQTWHAGQTALAHLHFWITPQERGEQQPLYNQAFDLAVTADARLDNRDELFELLDIDPHEQDTLSDASLILLAYHCWAERCAGYLRGDFAFVIWDGARQQLYAARDVLGNRDLAYAVDQGQCVLASEVAQVLAYTVPAASLNEGKLAEYILMLGADQHETLYQDIYYLPPGHYLLASREQFSVTRYWDIDPTARIRYRQDEDYAGHYLELLNAAVKSRLRSFAPLGVSLSGGLDSTSLAAIIASQSTDSPPAAHLKTFSYIFDELRQCDERRWILPLAQMYDLDVRPIPCDDLWTLKNPDQWPLARDYILSDSYAWLPDAVAQAAGQDGCRLLIGGYYGDTLFGGGYYWAAELLAEMRLGELAKTGITRRQSIDPKLDFFEYGLRAFLPHSLKRLYRRRRPRSLAEWQPILQPDFIRRTDLLARKQQADGFGSEKFTRPGLLGRYQSLFHNSTAQGAAATRRFYNQYGVELEAPYQDRSLVEFVMALPADQLYRPGRDRWVQRNAMAGLLPEMVRERTQKTSFDALFRKGIQQERSTILELFRQPQVVARQIVNASWLSSQLASLSPESPGMNQLWLVLCLEMWLKRYFP
jgi:asparagine synthase (glutamine-hydrolysing)